MVQKLKLEKKIPIRIDFEDAEAEKFEVVKHYMGLKQNTEVIRALISEKYNALKALEEKRHLQRIREAEAMEWLEKGEYKSPM
jgi:2-methylcitrate dehydratase PrpD